MPESPLREIDIDRIWPNPNQPRQSFEPAALDELARSIRRDGVLQPVVVRPAREEGHFELVAGERRWRAAQVAGLLRVPAVVRTAENEHSLELALVENLQREDLNPIEAALAFRGLMDQAGLTQQEVADRVGKDRASVANTVRLLNLPRDVQDKVKTGAISAGHAKVLLAIGSPELQARLAARVAAEGLSVRTLEVLVKRIAEAPSGPTAEPGPRRIDPNVQAAVDQLERGLGTKVRIVQGKKGGRIELHFHDGEELERLYQLVLRSAMQRGPRTGQHDSPT